MAHHLRGPFALDSDHDAVGVEEIRNRRPFSQKFRIRSHIKQRWVGPIPHNDGADPLARIHRDRALFHHDLVLVDASGDFTRHRLHIGQIGVARFGGRCADRDEHYFALSRGRLQVAGKLDALSPVPGQQLGQKLFMNRYLSVPECRDFLLVVIDQDDLVPQIRKTRSRYQPHVPGTDHRDAHSERSPWIFHLHLRLVGVQILTVAVFPAVTAFRA